MALVVLNIAACIAAVLISGKVASHLASKGYTFLATMMVAWAAMVAYMAWGFLLVLVGEVDSYDVGVHYLRAVVWAVVFVPSIIFYQLEKK